MADQCPFCGLPEREHERRKFECGTYKSSSGNVTQATPCKMIAAAHAAREAAELETERAVNAKYAAERAQADAERERDNAIEAAKEPVAQMERFRYEFRRVIGAQIAELCLNIEVKTPGPD